MSDFQKGLLYGVLLAIYCYLFFGVKKTRVVMVPFPVEVESSHPSEDKDAQTIQ